MRAESEERAHWWRVIESNPVEGAERPKSKRRRWRILEPVEVGRVLRAFEDAQARTIFLTLMLTGVRRFELQALRPIALMARAGHRSMATTNQYLHLAGVVFRDEAAALEQRLLGAVRFDD